MSHDGTSARRWFDSAHRLVAQLRTRKVRATEALARTRDPDRRRELGAELIAVDGMLDRAIPNLTARRAELERAER
jgi:hypothetical protein